MSENAERKEGYKRLTVSQLKNYKGCEHYTDEEAEEIIETLEQLTIVLFKLYQKNKKIENHEGTENT